MGDLDAVAILVELPDLLVRVGDRGQEEGGHLGRSALQLLPTVRCLEDHLADLGQPEERAPKEKTSGTRSQPNRNVLGVCPICLDNVLSDRSANKGKQG